MKQAALGEELYAWFIDSVKNVKGRIPSFLLLETATLLAEDLKGFHQAQIESGKIPPQEVLQLPVLDYNWLRRWRRFFGISWRQVNLRFKISRTKLLSRLRVFWSNCLRVRFIHEFLEPGGELVWEGMDQKPCWFTAASQDKTLAVRGALKVAVKENVPMTRSRFTAMTRCRFPTPPTDGRELAVLFRAASGGAQIREELRVPDGVLLQFQEKGSYRLADVLDYFRWVIDRSRLPAPGPEGVAPGQEGAEGVAGGEAGADEVPEGVHAGLEGAAAVEGVAAGQAGAEGVAAGPAGREGMAAGQGEAERQEGPGRRVVYLLDWFAPHLADDVTKLVHHHGHAVLRIGGGLTGLVQVEDTHAHGPMTKAYKARETMDAHVQLRVRPDKLPSTSRQTVMERALLSWRDVNHMAASQGFISNGICNKLDGSEDDLLSLEVAEFWEELDMDAKRKAILEEVRNAIVSENVRRFEDYTVILEEYDAHAGEREGKEAWRAEVPGPGDDDVDGDGDVEGDGGSGTQTPVGAASEEDVPKEGDASDEAESQGDETLHAGGEVARAEEPVGFRVLGAAGSQDDSAHPLRREAHCKLTTELDRQVNTTMAALKAAVDVGGDEFLEATLRQRLRGLRKRIAQTASEPRIHLRAMNLEREKKFELLRAEDMAHEARMKELDAIVKVKKAEAEIAKARGREASAAAKIQVTEAEAARTEEKRLKAKQDELAEHRRLFLAATLAKRAEDYMMHPETGQARRERMHRNTDWAIRAKRVNKHIPIPVFWPPNTMGLVNVTEAGMRYRFTSKSSVLWSSPDFLWALAHKKLRSSDDHTWYFKELVERCMPGYSKVLGGRYAIPSLLAEARHILDLAFMAALYRYTQVVGLENYRCGLSDWPPIEPSPAPAGASV
jgi:hypothetical protein